VYTVINEAECSKLMLIWWWQVNI